MPVSPTWRRKSQQLTERDLRLGTRQNSTSSRLDVAGPNAREYSSQAAHAMQRDDVDEIAAIPLPTSPQSEVLPDANSLTQFTMQVVNAQDKHDDGTHDDVSATKQRIDEGDAHNEHVSIGLIAETIFAAAFDFTLQNTVAEAATATLAAPIEVQSPPPPTPPSKSEVLPRMSNDTNTEATFQDVPLEPPPPPSEKPDYPSIAQPQPANGHVEKSPETPRTPSAKRDFTRTRNGSSDSSSAGHQRSLTMSSGNTVSVVLISTALETIAASKEARRSVPLKEAVDNALSMVRSGQGGDKPREIFEPLRLACESGNEKLMIASLDCISKLISYSFFVDNETPAEHGMTPPGSPNPSAQRNSFAASQTNLRPPNLVDLVTHTITACHTETTSDAVSLQIVKALLSLVLSSTILVHQSSLLKAVRTVYNIFLLSPDPVNQTVAQGGLTQMVHHVFSRCKLNLSKSSDSIVSETTISSSSSPKQNGNRNDLEKTESSATWPESQSPPMKLPDSHYENATENGRVHGMSQHSTHIHDVVSESHHQDDSRTQSEFHQRE